MKAVISAILSLHYYGGRITDIPDMLPAAPLSRIDVLNARIASPSLSVAEQEDIVSQLEEAVRSTRNSYVRQTIKEMLGKLAARPDLVLIVADNIRQLQIQLRPRQPPPMTIPPQIRRYWRRRSQAFQADPGPQPEIPLSGLHPVGVTGMTPVRPNGR